MIRELFVEVNEPTKRFFVGYRQESMMDDYHTDTNHSVVFSTSAHGEELPVVRFLTPRQVAMIDEALSSLGEFGELRLIVERGRLRFLVTHQSYDALKWQPGVIKKGIAGQE